jgi:hypothetical protein
MKEADILKAILQWLELNRYCHWRNYVGPILRGSRKVRSPNPMAGLPDIMGVLKNRRGILFGVEVKTKTGTIGIKQHRWINTLDNAGAVCFVARSFDEFLARIKIEDP